ncbi:MAG: D-alanine--D-alanine ligase [Elusimicrobiota bacterium]
MKIKRVAVLYGGVSAEREISLKSGRAVIASLKRNGYIAVPVAVDRNFVKKIQAVICGRKKIDFTFIALHGPLGEDGTVQSVLELMGIPYSGSGVLASALSMNKIYTKKILEWHGLPTPEWRVVRSGGDISKHRVSKHCDRFFASLPLVVKPSDQGSAFGITIVYKTGELRGAIRKALRYGRNALVEKFIPGREITVGLLGDETLPVMEIIPVRSKFYDFSAKYDTGGSRHIVPADIPSLISGRIRKLAMSAFEALGCRAMARVDFRLTDPPGNRPYILEINTIPGMTRTSLLPEAAAAAGYTFDEMIDKIIKDSLE